MSEKNNERLKYSVLMPLWYKEKTEYLEKSLESMLTQTVKPSEIVMIADHELFGETQNLLRKIQEKFSDIPIRIIRKDELFGKGLGAILAYGVTQCQYPLIARMDTDDIAFPERCERELEILANQPDISVVGGGLEKFSSSPTQVEGLRIPPEKGRKLNQYSKFRNPFNHPTVMFRKEVILKVGNYAPIRECEDYELWYRVLKNNYLGYNLQYPVLHYRAGTDMLKRRKNSAFFHQSLTLILTMYREHYINLFELIAAFSMQIIRYYAPFQINKIVYKYVRT